MPDLPQLAARMIGIGFGGATVTAEAKALIARGVRNVIFFARNVESAYRTLWRRWCSDNPAASPAS